MMCEAWERKKGTSVREIESETARRRELRMREQKQSQEALRYASCQSNCGWQRSATCPLCKAANSHRILRDNRQRGEKRLDNKCCFDELCISPAPKQKAPFIVQNDDSDSVYIRTKRDQKSSTDEWCASMGMFFECRNKDKRMRSSNIPFHVVIEQRLTQFSALKSSKGNRAHTTCMFMSYLHMRMASIRPHQEAVFSSWQTDRHAISHRNPARYGGL